MGTNHYFNNFPNRYTSEQGLVEDLLVESIKIYGADCYYIVRESIQGSEQDLIYGEDPTAKFERYYKMEMYPNFAQSHTSGGDFMAKFGLQINENADFVLSRRTFTRYVPSNIAIRPREGDLIYYPLTTNLYEIKHVDHELNFYTLGRDSKLPYMYSLRCELFVYSQENINTGVQEIDDVELEGAYTISIQLNPLTGNNNYYIGETVFQGSNLVSAVATATAKDWDPTNKILSIINIKGIFANTAGIRGVSSNTYYDISNYNDMTNNTTNDYYQNKDIQIESDVIVDNSEQNPWGTI